MSGMTQGERLDYLVEEFKKDSVRPENVSWGVSDQTVRSWEREAVVRGSFVCPGEITFYRIWQLAMKKGVDIDES